MRHLRKAIAYTFLGLLLGGGVGCSTTTSPEETAQNKDANPTPAIRQLAYQYQASSQPEAWQVQASQAGDSLLFHPGGEGWAEYSLEIEEAGRYQVQLFAELKGQDPATFWIEDYVGNPDERTYNITGNMDLDATAENPGEAGISVDGSPLNKGMHRIRLHYKGGAVAVHHLALTLMKAHQETPSLYTQKMDGEDWALVWSDEFDGEGMPDTTKWTFDIGDWGWGNNELQYYTEGRLENARLENGSLIIEARKNDDGHEWSSARLTTRGKVSFLFGKIEFRAKVPTNRGNWAAGWTLGDDYVDELSWPYCGEIDILESVGYEMNDTTGDGHAHASIHCGAYYFKLGNQPTAAVPVENMHEAFHTYAVEWSPEGIKAFVDDREYFDYKDTSTPLAWPFDKAQNLILNLAMGGGWGGLKGMDESMQSQVFEVDYVRVYERR